MSVSIEQAALNAMAAWLAARLEGVIVEPRWADAARALPEKAITLIFAGPRRDTITEAIVEGEEIIHDGVTPRIVAPAAIDLATTLWVLNAARASFEEHRLDLGAHHAADTTHPITAPVATDLPGGLALAAELLVDVAAHVLDAGVHEHADQKNAPTLAAPTTLPKLIVAAEALRAALDRHYVARIYLWRLRDCEQPVQLDVWTTFEVDRDDLMARIEPLLNAAPSESAGFDDDIPVRNGTIVALGDGWPGWADFEFDAPDRVEFGEPHQQGEFRAMYRGSIGFPLLVRAQSPRLARISLQQRIAGVAAATSTTTTASPEPVYSHEYA